MLRSAFCLSVALVFAPGPGSTQDIFTGVAALAEGDFATAIREFRPLAEQGDAEAQALLGGMYRQGLGAPQDYPAALFWFRKAANRGNPHAQYDLGRMYDEGNGVPQDYVSAHMWLNLASGNGFSAGPAARDELAAKMTPADVSEAQRRARMCIASDYQDCD